MEIKQIAISPYSCSYEINEHDEEKIYAYYSKYKFEIYLNNLYIGTENKNIFSLYDLVPNTDYNLKLVFENGYESNIYFKTLEISNEIIINYQGKQDYTEIIQNAIDSVGKNGAVVIEEGIYDIRPIFLRDDLIIYLKKGAILLADTNRWNYPILDEMLDGKPLGTWEGRLSKMFASVITCIRVKNVSIVGQGVIDGNAQNSDWWIDHKNLRGGARPRDIYLNYCDNVLLQGITVQNTACWTLHPYYSDNLKFVNLIVMNPKVSPNTDGLDPESVNNLEILGCYFSVGDDCIAIKSGKIEMTEEFYRPSEFITIRNCLMRDGHGAIVLGSEMSSGIKNLSVEKCLFNNTDRGLRIKTRRGRGKTCVVDNVLFKDIIMTEVLNPFVINMFYFCDSDGKSHYVQCKEALPVDDRTPYLGRFKFKNIICEDTTVSVGYFYGLPEQRIKEIEFENVTVNMKESDIYFYPAMMCDIEQVNRYGCYFNNVEKVVINNFKINNQIGDALMFNNVDKIERK